MDVKMKESVILIYAIFGIAYGRVDSSSFKCAVDEFSCGNGECIDSTSVCDGTLHCKDGSDESLHACGFLLTSSAKKLSSIGLRTRRAPKTVTYSSCAVPPQPKNGMRKLHRFSCDGDEDCDVAEGSSLDAGSQLTYACEPGFRLEGNSHVYCLGQGKWSPIPVCERIKCEALITASTLAICSRRGNPANCQEPVLPGTKAEVSCHAGYKQDTNSAITRRNKIECMIDGEWNPKPVICIPACGVAIDRKTPLMLNGSTATVVDTPWHATLYQEIPQEEGPVKEFICGATVIHTKLVLTAAHCVFDEGLRSTSDPNTLHVATGNVIREFDSPLHDSNIVQKSPVRNVWISLWYYGLRGNYVADIALLELQKPLTFSSILVPACLDTSGISQQILEPGSFGRVAGFGEPQYGVGSGILQTIMVPYVTYSACRNSRQGFEDEVYITDDKFCAGRINGTQAVCESDNGGGIVFKKNDLWYVMGVVSVALGIDPRKDERKCEKHSYMLYTNVATYIHWIQDVIYGLESSGNSPPCDLKCIPVNSESTMTNCFLSGRWTPCDFPVPCQTKARISCREGYVKSTTGQDSVECNSMGEWNPKPVVCKPLATTPAVSPIVPNATTETTPTTPATSPSVSSPGIPCNLPDGRRGICVQANRCPYTVARDSSSCDSVGAIPNFCCSLNSSVTEFSTTSSPTSALPTVATAPWTDRNASINEVNASDRRGLIAGQKCAAYASFLPPRSLITIGDIQCTNTRAPEQIQAFRYAGTHEFPYMAKIGFNVGPVDILWKCGAILISENYVISLAVCSQHPTHGQANRIQLGYWYHFNRFKLYSSLRHISQIIRDPIIRGSSDDALALYKMDRPIIFDQSILPACLYRLPDVDATSPVTVMGWLRYDTISTSVSSSGVSMMNTRVADQDTCNPSYPFNSRKLERFVSDSIICVDDNSPNDCTAFCLGAAMVVATNNPACMKQLVGIGGFGSPCYSKNSGAYIRVYPSIEWIESVVWPKI